MDHPGWARRTILAALIASCGLGAPVFGQGAGGADLGSDRGFGGVRFPIQAADGAIELSGRAGWLWKSGSTHRVQLNKDVRVVLGGDVFNADEASLWLEPMGEGVYQVFGVFRGVRADQRSIDVRAETLPVRGVIRASEPVRVRVDARFDGPPRDGSDGYDFHEEAQSMFGSRVVGTDEANGDVLVREGVALELEPSVTPGSTAAVVRNAAPADAPRAVFRPDGVFSFSVGDRIVVEGGASGKNASITATGGIVMQYIEPSTGRSVDMKAERAVVFLKSEAPLDRTLSRLGADEVEGVYLEGGVIGGDERWTVRSPKVYLDVARGRALMLDAVFWTTDQRTGMPVYVRADAVRQESQRVFSADRARLSNSAFFEPDVFIGVRKLEVTLEDERPDGTERVRVKGKSVTLNALGVPVLWLPGFEGDPDGFPLRRVSVGDSNRTGGLIETRWNLQSLAGYDWPGVELDLLLDYYTERGIAVGLDGTWNTPRHRGGLFAYLLASDDGTDLLSPGTEIQRDSESRGMFWLRDIWDIRDNWTLIGEASHISDEAFVQAFFPELASSVEDFRNRLIIERQGEHSQLAVELSGTEAEFISSEHLLQTPGYRVDRLPEARFVWGQQELFEEWLPGLLSYGFEARAGSLRLRFSEATAASYGFSTASLADDAFGTTPGQSVGDILRAGGYTEDAITRLDSRHEVVATLRAGPVRVTPFVVGRVTAYDQSFDAFSPQEADDTRLWGAAGVTFSTTLQKVNNDAESRALDVHRMRHIVEPSLTLWAADTNVTNDELPIYDDDVENLLAGTMIRAAVDQTWQTKRGGAGRWRDVDLLKVRTEYVWTSDRGGTSAIPRWYEARPELSRPGEYVGVSAIWQPTEVVAVAGEVTYDFDADRVARSSGGVLVEHRPGFLTSYEMRRVAAIDATYAAFGAQYRLTDKYGFNTSVTYNFDEADFQDFTGLVLRRFQAGTFGLSIGYNNIRGETSFGFVFTPGGQRGGLDLGSLYSDG
ncbi:MAG: LPS assembly protein LptD [Phycisphaerales bacterium]